MGLSYPDMSFFAGSHSSYRLGAKTHVDSGFRPRTHREGDHFHFSQQIFILSKEELAGPAEEQIFARQNLLCLAMARPT